MKAFTLYTTNYARAPGRQLLAPRPLKLTDLGQALCGTPRILGEGFLVLPRDRWELFFEGVAELSDDFMQEGRVQPDLRLTDWRT